MAVCSVANTPCVSFANATCLDEIRSLLENCIDAVGLLVVVLSLPTRQRRTMRKQANELNNSFDYYSPSI
jgi:hypothetical protein